MCLLRREWIIGRSMPPMQQCNLAARCQRLQSALGDVVHFVFGQVVKNFAEGNQIKASLRTASGIVSAAMPPPGSNTEV